MPGPPPKPTALRVLRGQSRKGTTEQARTQAPAAGASLPAVASAEGQGRMAPASAATAAARPADRD